MVGEQHDIEDLTVLRGWSVGPEAKSNGCSSRGPELIPSNHMVAYSHL